MSTAALRLEPVLLLFAAGSCIGLIFPLGRLAGEAGVPPLLYAAASAFGASLVLFAAARLSGSPAAARKGVLTYALVAGQLTFAIPFGMLVAVIPHLGSGIPAILQSLAPIITLAIVATLGLERPSLLRLVGLASGLAGAVLILISRNSGSFGETAPAIWYVAALTTPLALAAGNVFRTVAWPQAEKPLPLAAVTLAAAALGLAVVLLVGWLLGQKTDVVTGLAAGWHLILLQSLASGIGYALFFRLQQIGGPVYLSQISYVHTGVGVAFAVLFFAEPLSAAVWIAVALILAGVALVNREQQPR
ncbi:MAG: DMT family transporter [Pseudomonadota bacterium]